VTYSAVLLRLISCQYVSEKNHINATIQNEIFANMNVSSTASMVVKLGKALGVSPTIE
jgi:hypothetical protein